MAAAGVEHGHVCFGQSAEHAEDAQAIVAQFHDNADEQSQACNHLHDELDKVGPQVGQNAADGDVNQRDQAGDDNADPNGHTRKAVEQDTDGSPFCSNVQQLAADTGDGNQQLSSAVIAHLQVFRRGLDAQRAAQTRPAGDDGHRSQGRCQSDVDRPPEVDGHALRIRDACIPYEYYAGVTGYVMGNARHPPGDLAAANKEVRGTVNVLAGPNADPQDQHKEQRDHYPVEPMHCHCFCHVLNSSFLIWFNVCLCPELSAGHPGNAL